MNASHIKTNGLKLQKNNDNFSLKPEMYLTNEENSQKRRKVNIIFKIHMETISSVEIIINGDFTYGEHNHYQQLIVNFNSRILKQKMINVPPTDKEHPIIKSQNFQFERNMCFRSMMEANWTFDSKTTVIFKF